MNLHKRKGSIFVKEKIQPSQEKEFSLCKGKDSTFIREKMNPRKRKCSTFVREKVEHFQKKNSQIKKGSVINTGITSGTCDRAFLQQETNSHKTQKMRRKLPPAVSGQSSGMIPAFNGSYMQIDYRSQKTPKT